MTRHTYAKMDAEAKHRVTMKRSLRLIGCEFDNTESTEMLEEMMQINNLCEECGKVCPPGGRMGGVCIPCAKDAFRL